MNLEKHTPETLTELLERIKTLHLNEGLGRKRDEITLLLDQCLDIADCDQGVITAPYKFSLSQLQDANTWEITTKKPKQ